MRRFARTTALLPAMLLVALVGSVVGSVVVAAPAGASVHVVRPGESIQSALDAAGPGDRVVVQRGVYRENVAISTDGVSLVGAGAVLEPPVVSTPNPCDFGAPVNATGICVHGLFDDQSQLLAPVVGVTVQGFTVRGFEFTGVFVVGGEDVRLVANRFEDNLAYGAFSNDSRGTLMVANHASGSEEAGLYVGDSPESAAVVIGNTTNDNGLFGLFVRDATGGTARGNRASGNCVGIMLLETGAPSPSGEWTVRGNVVTDNDRFCPPDEEEGTPAFSGTGILVAGSSRNSITGNIVADNVPSGPVDLAGGIALFDTSEFGGGPPTDNEISHNLVVGNEPDLFWDGSGTGNVFARNLCRTSVPAGLCANVS